MAEARSRATTQLYIDQAMGRFLDHSSVTERAMYAWAYLRGLRRLGDDDLCRRLQIPVPVVPNAPYDLNLADAEHYMYARFLAGNTGDASVKALVVGYETAKVVKYLRGKEKDLRTDSRFPVLPPSIDAVNWGLAGAEDGLNDYKAAHNGTLGKFGSAGKANWEMVKGQYEGIYKTQTAAAGR